jgi:hypothetical protein
MNRRKGFCYSKPTRLSKRELLLVPSRWFACYGHKMVTQGAYSLGL